jgi:hypothetical protein
MSLVSRLRNDELYKIALFVIYVKMNRTKSEQARDKSKK